MTQYDQLSEDFRQKGGFALYEADIRAILNGFKFDQLWQMKIELSGGRIPVWLCQDAFESQSWYWTSRLNHLDIWHSLLVIETYFNQLQRCLDYR